MKTSTLRFFCLSLLVAFFVVFSVTTSYALTLSPARVELAADAGQTLTGDVIVTNEQAETRTFYVSYENFTANGDTGAPSFTTEKTGLASWVSVQEESITLAPGQSKEVSYVIRIPSEAEAGGYFSAIFWSTSPPGTKSGEVSIGAKVGMLLLLRINGDVRESAGIASFTRGEHGFFYNTLPISFVYTFNNTGADRVKPEGFIKIRNLGVIPGTNLEANKVDGNVLPGSTRKFETQWLKHVSPEVLSKTGFGGFIEKAGYQWKNFAVGLYRAKLDLSYGVQTVMQDTRTVWFFVFPWQLLICLFVGLVVAYFFFKTILRKYNRYIIAKARGYDSKR